jgi:hypothetical protein
LDREVMEVRVAPGGTFGWRGHPGLSLVIVREGTDRRAESGHLPYRCRNGRWQPVSGLLGARG